MVTRTGKDKGIVAKFVGELTKVRMCMVYEVVSICTEEYQKLHNNEK